MFGVWCRVSGGSRRKETEAWLQDVRRGIAVFESREEAEAEAARLSAQMNSDPWQGDSLTRRANCHPPCSIGARRDAEGICTTTGSAPSILTERASAGSPATLEGFVAFSSPIVEGMRKRRSPLAFSASAMRAFINPAVEGDLQAPARTLGLDLRVVQALPQSSSRPHSARSRANFFTAALERMHRATVAWLWSTI